jgi:WYL domain
MSRKGQSITLSISEQDKAQLEALASEFGMTWGDRPNISKLVEAIARKQLTIAPNHDWTQDRINTLNQTRSILTDLGRVQDALAVATLLLERSELTIPLRAELDQFMARPATALRLEIDRYIRRNQPFRLSYQDAAEEISHFNIYYAEIVPHDERQYLDCWCQETNGDRHLPDLEHNRCLRLDRIADAALTPIQGQWRDGLGSVTVEMHFYRGLAFAYRSKTNQDIENDWHPNLPQVRLVQRKITSPFWFMREVLRYGKDCEVISPDEVRNRIKQEVEDLYSQYLTSSRNGSEEN